MEYQAHTISLSSKKGDHFRLALSHKDYGDIFFVVGDFSRALKYYLKSEDI